MSKPLAMDTITLTGRQRGKELVPSAVDTVTVVFADSFAYATATGSSGYVFSLITVYLTDALDPVKWSVTTKTVTGFTITFDRTFTGEVDWETQGVPA